MNLKHNLVKLKRTEFKRKKKKCIKKEENKRIKPYKKNNHSLKKFSLN